MPNSSARRAFTAALIPSPDCAISRHDMAIQCAPRSLASATDERGGHHGTPSTVADCSNNGIIVDVGWASEHQDANGLPDFR
jgi:hypothetical protein